MKTGFHKMDGNTMETGLDVPKIMGHVCRFPGGDSQLAVRTGEYGLKNRAVSK